MDSTNLNGSSGDVMTGSVSPAVSAVSSRTDSPEVKEIPVSNSQPTTTPTTTPTTYLVLGSTSWPMQPLNSHKKKPLKKPLKTPSRNTNRMVWTRDIDNVLIAEVNRARPYQFRIRTTERKRAWQQIAEAMQRRGFKVDARAVRDHVNALKARCSIERASTGISAEETVQEKRIREAVEQWIQEEEECEMAPKEKVDEGKEKTDGAEMRKGACETSGESRKRHQSDSDPGTSPTPRKLRNSKRDRISLVERRREIDLQIKREEMERRREEDEERRRIEEERRQLEEERRQVEEERRQVEEERRQVEEERRQVEEERRRIEEERRRIEEERRRVEEEKRQAEDSLKESRIETLPQQMLQQQQQMLQLQQQNQQQNQQMLNMMMILIKSFDKTNDQKPDS